MKPLSAPFSHLMTEQLIQLCKEGNQSAQQEFYERYATAMIRLCFRYIRNQMDAEEVMINGFVKVFNHLEGFDYRGPEKLEGWIRRIMVNEALMFLRKKHNFNMVSDSEMHLADQGAIASDHLEAEDLYQMIQELPVGYRTVFNLYAIEGFSHKEIAQQLSISESTSKSQLHKARLQLQKQLRQDEKDTDYEGRRIG